MSPAHMWSQFLQFEYYPFYQQQQQQQQLRKSAIWAGNKKARLVNAAFIQNCCLQLFMANLRLLSGCRLPDPLRIKASFAQAISLEGWGVRWASREVIHGQKQNSNGGKVWTFPYRSMTLRPYGSCWGPVPWITHHHPADKLFYQNPLTRLQFAFSS